MCTASWGQDAHDVDRLSRSEQWLRLLHYKKRFWIGPHRSIVNGPEFFFSAVGYKDPAAELLASVQAFSKDIRVGKLKQHPQCAFPERYRFLKSALGLRIPDVDCPLFRDFLNKFQAKSVSLVFSSAYVTNPASAFGHTFLKINAKKGNDLLDWGINAAAAVADDENPLAFFYFGITGGYVNQFSMVPYYLKVNEYVNSESRDLWEYELNLSEEETTRFLAHLWEIETNSWFDYYFFDRNCSYIILAALEAVKTDWDVTGFPIYVIPGESVKKVTAIPGAVRKVIFRPSLRKVALQHYEALNSGEKKEFSAAMKELVPGQSPLVLETMAKFLQYQKQKNGNQLGEAEANLQKQVLLKRSSQGPLPSGDELRLQPIPEETRPDWGHDGYRLGTSSGIAGLSGTDTAFFQEIAIKSAYHDLMNKDLGYVKNSQIDFPGLEFRYNGKDRVFSLEKAIGLGLTALSPLNVIDKTLSWHFDVGSYSPKDFGCVYCHVGKVDGGTGLAIDVLNSDVLLYSFVLGRYELGNSFSKGYRWGPVWQTALLVHPFTDYKMKLEGDLIWDLDQSDRTDRFWTLMLEQSLSLARNWETRLSVASQKNYSEGKLVLNYYFN